MTIKEANNKLEKIDNDINYWLTEKEIELSKALPKATDITQERVSGGTRVDKFMKYAEALEVKQIDEKLDKLYAQKKNLEDYLDKELYRLQKYGPLERKIITLRSEKGLRWREISVLTGYCERQCQRIYDKYYRRKKKKRSI